MEENTIIGAGIKRTISTSKTRKITARRKNRVEKGIRALFLGSKPHSKGEVFSRSILDRALKEYAINITIGGKIAAIIKAEKRSIGNGVLPIINIIKVIRSSGALPRRI